MADRRGVLNQTRHDGIYMLVCAIKNGRHSHAVTLELPHRRSKPNMSALNSHGSANAIIEVTRANFEYAVLVKPKVVGWKKDGGQSRQRMPPFTTAFKEMKEAEDEAVVAAIDEEEQEEELRTHHPSSGDDLKTLKELAKQHPAHFMGHGTISRNGKPSSSGWTFVSEERAADRKTEFRACNLNGDRICSGTLLQCVHATLATDE